MNVGSSNDLKEQREDFVTDSRPIHYSGPLACLLFFLFVGNVSSAFKAPKNCDLKTCCRRWLSLPTEWK